MPFKGELQEDILEWWEIMQYFLKKLGWLRMKI